MTERLTVLCARKIAEDFSSQERLKFVLETLPKSLSLLILNFQPLNHIILPESIDGNSVLDDWWLKLCEKCAKNNETFREKFQRLSKKDGGKHFRELLLNSYFEELLFACSNTEHSRHYTVIFRFGNNHQPQSYQLQRSLGQHKHNISDEKMLAFLAKHITELSLLSQYIPCIQGLILSDHTCLTKLEFLKVHKCQHSSSFPVTGGNFAWIHSGSFPVAGGNSAWIFCIEHILRNSKIKTISGPTCCKILGDGILSFTESRTGSKQDIKELILSVCQHNFHLANCYDLECLRSLERLTITFNFRVLCAPHFFLFASSLLKIGLPHLKYIHIIGVRFITLKPLITLGKYLLEGIDFDKNVILENICIEKRPKDAAVSLPYTGHARSSITCLAISGIGTMHDVLDLSSHAPSFAHLISTFNPQHLLICCDRRGLGSITSDFALPETTLALEKGKISLRKITVIYQSLPLCQERRPLADILQDLIITLKDSAKDVDLRVFCDEGKLVKEDSCSQFKSFEAACMRVSDSV